jgi:ElaB/YqjD/DUF883 family membrane-anchored ribosome-binding protein
VGKNRILVSAERKRWSQEAVRMLRRGDVTTIEDAVEVVLRRKGRFSEDNVASLLGRSKERLENAEQEQQGVQQRQPSQGFRQDSGRYLPRIACPPGQRVFKYR